ncbi:MAG TPA: TA system VapC family ribonuclease toxin [Chloroflexota bacterium]|nr:TA system VapC family ribonuclease toxin [Chloroflexota bacterium]
MIAVDANLLVYALRQDSPWHEKALSALSQLAAGSAPWGIPWPCAHEFLSIATHPRIYQPPTPLDVAIQAMEVWLASPSVVLLAEADGYWPALVELVREGQSVGPRVHDARIAALCLLHGVRELWTADRDFSRFPSLRVRNPLVG